MSLSSAVLGAGAVTAAAAYLDAKFLIRNDLTASSVGSGPKAIKYVTKAAMADRMLIYHLLENQALGKNAINTFLIFEGKEWTYREFYDTLHRVGHWLINDLGIQKNEVVAMNGGNSAAYIMIWLGLDSIGAVPAKINCNLTAQPLIHCVKVAKSRFLLSDVDVSSLVSPCEDELTSLGIKTVYYSAESLATLPDLGPTPESRRNQLDPLSLRSLIYTSGTTGLPKAVMMWTSREIAGANEVANYLKLSPKSRMYTCMPLYHGAAHALCTTACIRGGATVVLGRKFSHKTFWPEVASNRATIVQYVGELCRYLVNAPHHPLERAHCVQMAWGNGMRPDVWEKFRERFGIPVINELYAATDGMGKSLNANRGEFGRNAIGVRGLIWSIWNWDAEVRVKIDVVTEEIVRDERGFAIKCGLGEPGEVLHRLDPAAPNATFQGYYGNPTASNKRMIRDVFKEGDLYFRSGDMQRQDPDGCVYFVDRLGDTFRWKSENVSTNEVSDVLGKCLQIAEANVYGVSVPHSDGRAGCGAVVLADGVTLQTVDWKLLADHLIGTLPRYAVPIFIRVLKSLEYTGTMKLVKGRFKEEGVDPENIEKSDDVIFWLPMGATKYEKFGRKEWDGLWARRLRL